MNNRWSSLTVVYKNTLLQQYILPIESHGWNDITFAWRLQFHNRFKWCIFTFYRAENRLLPCKNVRIPKTRTTSTGMESLYIYATISGWCSIVSSWYTVQAFNFVYVVFQIKWRLLLLDSSSARLLAFV